MILKLRYNRESSGFAKSRPTAHGPRRPEGPAASGPRRPGCPEAWRPGGLEARRPGDPVLIFQVFCPAINPRACTDLHRVWASLGGQYGRRWVWIRLQGCTLTAPSRLRRPTFGLGRLKERDWSPGRAPSSLVFLSALPGTYRLILSWRCSNAGDRFLSFNFGRLRVILAEKYSFAQHALKLFFKLFFYLLSQVSENWTEWRRIAVGKMQMTKCGW